MEIINFLDIGLCGIYRYCRKGYLRALVKLTQTLHDVPNNDDIRAFTYMSCELYFLFCLRQNRLA